METKVYINSDYITLGQFLKFENICESGGMVKIFLSEYQIKINGELDNRRGKKLYPKDVVEIEDFGVYIIEKQ
ncbi:S4 domain-containing protein YaaA [Haloplasma contractile]|uniref:S4 domain protein n=1 Tax=Haloplasma contractile SSD-17B TaxID=1033810 RepID=F7PT48_9MOLU|nr:S4 domain-containing protein YaaA [Haloplasma contractile]ERJ12536.1 S4 domain protein [Haloplasma contractile SSD-17B]